MTHLEFVCILSFLARKIKKFDSILLRELLGGRAEQDVIYILNNGALWELELS
jgi:hypothetical protein